MSEQIKVPKAENWPSVYYEPLTALSRSVLTQFILISV